MQITKEVVFIAKNENIFELKELLKTMVIPSQQEDGCLLYKIYQTKNKPATFVVIETWENDAALNGHKNSSHYKHYKANFEQYTLDKFSNELSDILL
ncbi:MAG: antibiotic biosynthesis monooxygenase [Helicobacteraceae bacterium]|nr:antibiotic biosynthesis monooxygenase [Helicobacteraceae bacterium]